MKKHVVWLVLFLVVSLFVVQMCEAQFFSFKHPLEGKPAPDFTLNTLQSQNINFGEYRDDKASIIFFWATWCPHCRRELKDLKALVNIEEPAGQIRSYLKRANLTFDIFMDTDATVAQGYKIMGVPSYFLVDKEGSIRSVGHVFPEDYEDTLRAKKK